MSVRPSLESSFTISSILSFRVHQSLFRPSLSSLCSSLTSSLFLFSRFIFFFSSRCPADSNVGTTSLQTCIVAWRGHRNIERTFPRSSCLCICMSILLQLLLSLSSYRCADEIRMYWFCRFLVWWLQDKGKFGNRWQSVGAKLLTTSIFLCWDFTQNSKILLPASCKSRCVRQTND